jgi:hypothetical protein
MNRLTESLRRRPALAALLGYAVGAIVLTFPLILHLSEGIRDLPAGDPGQHLWNIWWLGKALGDPNLSVLQSDYLFHPVGTGLGFHAYHPLLSLGVLAIEPLTGRLPAYNLLLILGPLLSAWGLFLCAREWGAPPRAAWLAGFLFLFAPFRTEIWAHWEIQSTQWIPFYLLFLRRAMLRGGIADIFGCAVFLIFTALTAWYHLAILLFASLVLAPALALSKEGSGGPGRRFLRLLAAASLTIVLFSPYLLVLVRQTGTSGEVPGFEAMHHWSSDVLNFILPVPVQKWIAPGLEKPYYRFESFGNHLVYPGTVLWILTIASLILLRRKVRSVSLLFAAFLLFILSLGPALKCGTLVFFPGTEMPIPLPGYYLLRKVPLLNALRTTCRLGIGVTPLLALFAAVNWEPILERLGGAWKRREWVIIGIACAIALFEGWSAPLETHPVSVPSIYAEISGNDPRAVIEIPGIAIADLARSMYFQTFHERPLVGGYLARPDPAFEKLTRSSPLLTFLWNPGQTENHRFSPTMRRTLRSEAATLRLGSIVVHGDRLTARESADADRFITDMLGGQLVAEDGPHRLYRLSVDDQIGEQ